MRALALLAILLLPTSCASDDVSEADRELLRYMPAGSEIHYRQIHDYGVKYRARFVSLPFRA